MGLEFGRRSRIEFLLLGGYADRTLGFDCSAGMSLANWKFDKVNEGFSIAMKSTKSHRIQLKGPWDYAWKSPLVDGLERESQSGTVTMPRDWQSIFGDRTGTAEFRRKFHRPTNLESHENVILNFTGTRGQIAVWLNREQLGVFIGTGNPVEFDVTSRLKEFNELCIEVTFDPQFGPDVSGGLYGIVALEIISKPT